MFKMKNDKTVKPAFRGKRVEIITGGPAFCRVKLLENAGPHKTGAEFNAFRSQIESHETGGM